MTPDELLGILRTNIVKTGGLQNSSMYGRPERLELTPDTFFKGRDSAGKTVPVLNLKQGTGPKAFTAYVCDYKRGELHYQVLGKEADFCFTITMNGCTFGVSNPSSDGTVLVSHGNQAEVKDGPGVPTGNMHEKQNTLAKGFHGDNVSLLEPSEYRQGGNENISTVGMRVNGAWKFYYQTYKAAGGGVLELVGFTEFKTQNIGG